MITKETLKKQLSELHQERQTLVEALGEDEKKSKQEAESFEVGYQSWVRGMPADDRARKARAGRPAQQDAQPGRWRSHPVSWCTQSPHP